MMISLIAMLGNVLSTANYTDPCSVYYASVIRDYHGSVDDRYIDFLNKLNKLIKEKNVIELKTISKRNIDAKLINASLDDMSNFDFYGCLNVSGTASGIGVGKHGEFWLQDNESGNLEITKINSGK